DPDGDEALHRRAGGGGGQAAAAGGVRHRRNAVGRGVLLRRGAAHGALLRLAVCAAGDRTDAAWQARHDPDPAMDRPPPEFNREPATCRPCTRRRLTTTAPPSPPARACWRTTTRTIAPAAGCWTCRWGSSPRKRRPPAWCCSR